MRVKMFHTCGDAWIEVVLDRDDTPPRATCGVSDGRATDAKIAVACRGHLVPLRLLLRVVTWVPCTSGMAILSIRP